MNCFFYIVLCWYHLICQKPTVYFYWQPLNHIFAGHNKYYPYLQYKRLILLIVNNNMKKYNSTRCTYLFSISVILWHVTGETTNKTAFFCERKQPKKNSNQLTKILRLLHCKKAISHGRTMKITMIHACERSIVRAVGVTKTVSHPYGFQWEILLLKPVDLYWYK